MEAIYQIKNKLNGKIYIGSTNNIRKRWNNHKSKLNNNKHENQYLQQSWTKHGKDAFEFSILEEVTSENRIKKEIEYLNETKYYERDIGYNFDKNPTDKSGESNPFYGKQHSEETKKKIGMKNKGRGKLNMEKAKEIRKLYSEGNYTYKSLAIKYSLFHTTIARVIKNQGWVESKE